MSKLTTAQAEAASLALGMASEHLRLAQQALASAETIIASDNGETRPVTNARGALSLVSSVLNTEHQTWAGYAVARAGRDARA